MEEATPAGPDPEELSRSVPHRGRVLEFHSILWQDSAGGKRVWESVERASGLEAVMTIPWLVPSERLLLIRQFRPPARGAVIEFPAGIIDPGESAEKAALRELAEETGYSGRVVRMIPPTFNTPGLSGETVYQAFVEIDEDLAENRAPQPKPDEGEHIRIFAVARADLRGFVETEIAAGAAFDSKVMAYILGLAEGMTKCSGSR